jgi:hypothetical protein
MGAVTDMQNLNQTLIVGFLSVVGAAYARDAQVDLRHVKHEGELSTANALFNSAVKPIELPLDVVLTNISPLSVAGRAPIEALITIRNIGSKPLSIPISKNLSQVYSPGNLKRRSASLGLQISSSGTDRAAPITEILDFTVGSETIPSTMVDLEPGDTLSIQLGGALADFVMAHRAEHGVLRVRVQAVYSESYLNDELVVTNFSSKIVSSNSLDLTIEMPR